MSTRPAGLRLKALARDATFRSPLRPLVFPEPRFVVVGTGRSGTGYIAKTLSACGLKTGHESWWRMSGTGRPTGVRLVGDASWCAVFNLNGYQGKVYHQIRNPLDVVASISGTELGAPWATAARRYRARYVPMTGDPVVDAMRITADYLDECERAASLTWRLEDINPALALSIGHSVGHSLDDGLVARHFAQARGGANARLHQELTWDDLPSGETKQRLVAHARAYDYL